ncbi:MAG: UPF0280 family protein [Candidatus Lokiarchaeota archaeon]|nr:UPF0280 family protein [Candidatus Lokiarchaeota archaeon]
MKKYKYHFLEQESDVTLISESKSAILKAKESLASNRLILEQFIKKNDKFLTSFLPIKIKTEFEIINLMSEASVVCDVGPMAAVAGAFADLMLQSMNSPEVALVENGGEIAIETKETLKIALFAGYNQLNLNLGFLIQEKDCPIGIGTSSATIGHAISLGQADAVTIFATTATLADGAATRVANEVKGADIEKSIKDALDVAENIEGVKGAFICREDKVGQVGNLPSFFKIEGNKTQILNDKLDTAFLGEYEIFD